MKIIIMLGLLVSGQCLADNMGEKRLDFFSSFNGLKNKSNLVSVDFYFSTGSIRYESFGKVGELFERGHKITSLKDKNNLNEAHKIFEGAKFGFFKTFVTISEYNCNIFVFNFSDDREVVLCGSGGFFPNQFLVVDWPDRNDGFNIKFNHVYAMVGGDYKEICVILPDFRNSNFYKKAVDDAFGRDE